VSDPVAARCVEAFEVAATAHRAAASHLAATFSEAVTVMCAALQAGKKILVCGNGGSAAESQHFAAELTGRFRRERVALAALALTVDTSALTAIGNDYGFERVFSRQVEALGQPGDVLLAISTSGRSPNVVQAAQVARARQMTVVGLTGRASGALGECAHLALAVPHVDTARVQEVHLTVLHVLCDEIERALAGEPGLSPES
jgi:D-sedoheptulose 7-phosphate isomerase